MKRSLAFSLLELLVAMATVALLAAFLFPALSRAKEASHRTACSSNLRQLHLALNLYAGDHDDYFPPRSLTAAWPSQVQPYYSNPTLLVCSSDRPATAAGASATADDAPRSYVLNGFAEPETTHFAAENWTRYLEGPRQGTIKLGTIQNPSGTILLGEKISASTAFYADLHQRSGSFLEVLEQARHSGGGQSAGGPNLKPGGANYAFVDGSVRLIGNGKTICPLNLWGITDYYRSNYAVCLF